MNSKKKLNDTLSFMSEHDRVMFLYDNILLRNPEDSFDLDKEVFRILFSSDINNADKKHGFIDDVTDANDFFSFLDEDKESFDSFSYSDDEMSELLDFIDENELEDDIGDPDVEVIINGNLLLIFSNSLKDIESYIYNYCFIDGYIFTELPVDEIKKMTSLNLITEYEFKKIYKIHGKLENEICYN
jgi:hypothetical protein